MRSIPNGVAKILGAGAALVALAVAAVLALLFAATVVVLAVVASALVGFTFLAMRARRTVRVRTRSEVIDARRVGHTWVAYGWNERR